MGGGEGAGKCEGEGESAREEEGYYPVTVPYPCPPVLLGLLPRHGDVYMSLGWDLPDRGQVSE